MPENYKQYDGRWANYPYAGQNMAAAGCGPTATADIIEKLPTEIADWMTAHGYASNGQGTYWGAPKAALEAYGIGARQLNSGSLYGNAGSSAENTWLSEMKTGKYYGILLMGPGVFTTGGHFICITQVDGNNKCYVHDPASAARDGWHPWSDFRGAVKIFYLAARKDGEITPAAEIWQDTLSYPLFQSKATKYAQMHLNNYVSFFNLEVDGIIGYQTLKAMIGALQYACNVDYGSGLEVDGYWGRKTEAALKGHWVQMGEKQELVRAVQILLLARGDDPIEIDASFGEHTLTAVKTFQRDTGLEVDGVAGFGTIRKLIFVI